MNGYLGIRHFVLNGGDLIDFNYTSGSGVAWRTQGQASAVGGFIGQGRVGVEFARMGGFVFRALRCKVIEIEDKAIVGRQIMAAYRRGEWQANWWLVDSVVRADRTTVLISQTNSSSVELLLTKSASSDLTRLDGELSVESQSGEVMTILAARGLSPMVDLGRIRGKLVHVIAGTPMTFRGSEK